ncbi:MAG: helix-turn-helix transcriptional regulator [Pseudomonadota bacterium]|jgi:transcriptional regulator with XRE-family HTH domain|nr:helix-turn-helix transcriptional regulator [Pseudomonadota bacterium]|tara:strand:+ start:3351 stop:3641 length:291 start_codon:yes stop_codon:yes gene_type:complete
MDKVEYTKKLIGNLVKQARAASMVQEELALRTGTSKNTVSRLERGKGINSDTLLTILNQLEVLDPLIETIEKEYELVSNNPSRKSSLVEKELPNDF